ncbi:hypothetical protein DQ04_09591010 [Trypanosoma grayi]|uniref:hypothetical protein n=1 Tax=Trypanosoma grayi TaxID=71804 RepID=UPI0004F4041F|nr:hypothetical protein DQ04_09591010 [Trypanosoma grayi]KEG07507.1 hypothetical protein DQ04_09591010 [Trypanosoma grayi]
MHRQRHPNARRHRRHAAHHNHNARSHLHHHHRRRTSGRRIRVAVVVAAALFTAQDACERRVKALRRDQCGAVHLDTYRPRQLRHTAPPHLQKACRPATRCGCLDVAWPSAALGALKVPLYCVVLLVQRLPCGAGKAQRQSARLAHRRQHKFQRECLNRHVVTARCHRRCRRLQQDALHRPELLCLKQRRVAHLVHIAHIEGDVVTAHKEWVGGCVLCVWVMTHSL